MPSVVYDQEYGDGNPGRGPCPSEHERKQDRRGAPRSPDEEIPKPPERPLDRPLEFPDRLRVRSTTLHPGYGSERDTRRVGVAVEGSHVAPDGIVQSNEDTVITVEGEPVLDGEVGPVLSREEMQKQLVEAKTVLQYAQAEVENVRKASERDHAEYARQAAWNVLEKILPPLDDLDAAMAGLPPEHAAGLSMVRNNFLNALHEIGLAEIKADGLQFDPYKHEAVEVITDSNLEDGTVAKVLRKGYSYNLKVLRPALVAVVKRGDPNGKDNRN